MGRIADMKKEQQERRKKKKTIFLVVMVVIGIIIAIIIDPIFGALIGLSPLAVNAMLEAAKDIVSDEVDVYKQLKEEVAPKEIEIMFPGAEYLPNEGIEEEQYKLAEYTNPLGQYNSSDKIISNVQITDEQICKIQFAEIEIKKDKKDKKPYLGIFAFAKLPKDIVSKVKITKSGTYESGNVFKVETGVKKFDEAFDVISPNKKLSSKILRNDIIENLISIYENNSKQIDVSIIRDTVYFRLECDPIIKNTADGKAIDKMTLERRYRLMRKINDAIVCIYNTINDIDI